MFLYIAKKNVSVNNLQYKNTFKIIKTCDSLRVRHPNHDTTRGDCNISFLSTAYLETNLKSIYGICMAVYTDENTLIQISRKVYCDSYSVLIQSLRLFSYGLILSLNYFIFWIRSENKSNQCSSSVKTWSNLIGKSLTPRHSGVTLGWFYSGSCARSVSWVCGLQSCYTH